MLEIRDLPSPIDITILVLVSLLSCDSIQNNEGTLLSSLITPVIEFVCDMVCYILCGVCE